MAAPLTALAAGVSAWDHAVSREPRFRECSAELARLVRASLDSGHHRVACRRLLMMKACGYDVPDELSSACAEHWHRLKPLELNRMCEAAYDFARLVRGRW